MFVTFDGGWKCQSPKLNPHGEAEASENASLFVTFTKGVFLMSTATNPASTNPVKPDGMTVPFKYLVLTNDTLAKQFLSFCEDNGVEAAAKQFNISPATVYSVLRALNAYTSAKRTVYEVTPEKTESAKKLLTEGRRATVVAKELNLSTSMVYNIAREAGISLKKGIEPTPIDAATLQKIEADLRSGKSAKQVSTDNNIAYVKVLDMAEKWGIKLDRKGKGSRGIFSRPKA